MKQIVLFYLFWVSLVPLFAQDAKISGHIYDEKKEPVLYSTVMLMQNGTVISGTYSDENGHYVFSSLKAGVYSIKVTLLGYENQVKNEIALKEKEEKIVDISLELPHLKAVEAVASNSSGGDDVGGLDDEGAAAEESSREEITELRAKLEAASSSDADGVADRFEIAPSTPGLSTPPPPPPAPMEVVVSASKIAVERDVTVSRSTISAKEIKKMPTREVAGIASKSEGYVRAEKKSKGLKGETKTAVVDKIVDVPKKEEKKEPLPKAEPNPLAGKLTAGEVNDFAKWKMWKGIAKDEFKDFQNEWKMIPQDRYVIQVENKQHHPMPNLKVELRSKEEVIWTGKTDNTGKAELWADFFQQIPQVKGSPTLIRVYFDGKSQDVGQIMPFSRGINHASIDKKCDKNLQVDIAFVVDATGSMGDEIAHIRADLSQIASGLKDTLKGWEVNFGSVFYQDQGDAYLTKSTPFSTDVKQTQDFMLNTPYGGGGDFPEAVESGLEEAVQKLGWNENASTRIVFLVLDAPSHNDIETLIKLQMQIRAAAHKGIRIIPVACSGIDKSTEYLLRSIALATNGTYAFLTDDSGIGGTHLKPTTDDFKVEKFYQLAVRLVSQYTYQPDCEPEITEKPKTETVFQSKIVEKSEAKAKKDGDVILGKDSANNKVWVAEKTVSWKYYPNPTKGDLTIEVEDNIGEIFLSDINGKVLERFDVKQNNSFKIDLSPYANGIYFLRYEYETDKWLNGKVILER